jgi:HNH endonuclease
MPQSIKRIQVPWAGKRFSELSEQLAGQLLETKLPIVVVEKYDNPDEIRDLFIRLQAGTPLTRQQVRDAWPGNLGPYIESLAGKLRKRPRFRVVSAVDLRGSGGEDEDNQDPYLNDRQTCAQMLCIFLARRRRGLIPSVGTRQLDELYHTETEFDTSGLDAQGFETCLGWCDQVLNYSGGRSRKIPKRRIFSLMLLLEDLSLSDRVKVEREIGTAANAFWSDSESEPPSGKGTSSTAIANYYDWFLSEAVSRVRFTGLDPHRDFSPEQKVEIWNRANGLCAECGQAVPQDQAEYDHVRLWILGGRTTVENGRPLHPGCHARGLAAVTAFQTRTESLA